MSNEIEMKRLADVESVETVSDEASVLIIQDGEVKQTAKSNVGGGLPEGGASHQQLVTDADGVAKWEDRLAYDARPANTTLALGDFALPIYKISDDIPDFLQDITESTSVNVWLNGSKDTVEFCLLSDEYAFAQDGVVVVAYNDNVEVYNGDRFICTLPERGLYLAKLNETYVEGIAPAGTEEPVITWNGFTGILKTIDPKYIPEAPIKSIIFKINDATKTYECNMNTFSKFESTLLTGSPVYVQHIDDSGSIMDMCPAVYIRHSTNPVEYGIWVVGIDGVEGNFRKVVRYMSEYGVMPPSE